MYLYFQNLKEANQSSGLGRTPCLVLGKAVNYRRLDVPWALTKSKNKDSWTLFSVQFQ